MRNLDSIEIEKIEGWLDRVELFLMELPATDRAQIILDLNAQTRELLMNSPELKVDEALKSLGEPMPLANRIRSERGFKPRKRIASKSKSFASFLLISIFACLFLFTTCTLSLPFVVPWGLNRIAIQLGQQPEGIQSFHFFKAFNPFGNHSDQKGDKNDPNDLNSEAPESAPENEESQVLPPQEEDRVSSQENINGSFQSDEMSAILIQAKNTKLIVSASKNPGEINYDCKISSLGYARPFIRKSPSGQVTVAIDQVADAATCEIKIPPTISLEIQVESGSIQLNQLKQKLSVIAGKAEVHFTPPDQAFFEIEAKTSRGEVKGLEELEKRQKQANSKNKFKAKILVQDGDIIFK